MAQIIPFDRGRPGPGARPAQCQANTVSGRRCRNAARSNGFCAIHQPPAPSERLGPIDAGRVRDLLDFIRRRAVGDYHVDEFGFDPELTEKVLLPLIKPLYERYWRTEWIGLGNVPSKGGALLVANHAGPLPIDSLVMKFGVLDRHPAHRHVRLLAADLAFRTPFIGASARKMGSTLACEEDALRLLHAGELVGVFPEGYKGVGKGWKNRYRLQRFGRGGFVDLALRAKVPIVPVAIVGSEEIFPMIHNSKVLARLGGFPYFPITPTFPLLGPLGMVPLPSKWIIEFGPRIATDDLEDDAWEDRMLVFELTDRIRDTTQQMLFSNLMHRGHAFL